MKHGGDLLSYKHMYDGELIDFSSNINPLGLPNGLKEFLTDEFNAVTVYPDIEYRLLKKEVAKYLGCTVEEVLLGNGAIEIINYICTLFHRVVVPYPCFIEYSERPERLGKEVIKVYLGDKFKVSSDLISPYIKAGDLLILGNPNNPTGFRIDRGELLKIHSCIKSRGAFLLLDEVFFEFCDFDYNSIELFKESENVFIVRAATKFFALPGIRLGYAFAPKDLAKRYEEITLPWSINAFAELAGKYVFNQDEYIKESKEYSSMQRKWMLSELKQIKEIEVFYTDCNYVLLKLIRDNEENLFKYMLSKGIVIRKASSFDGLDGTYIRLAIKDEKSNKYLIECIKARYFGIG